MRKVKYLIVADDFTGANDTGVQLQKNGMEAEVLLFPATDALPHSVVLDTESRTIPADQAYLKVKRMTSSVFANNHFDLVYKKIDSTIRGNIGEELKALLEVYQPDKVVFAPAFPKIGRTTVSGIHRLNGVPLMQTEMAKDPLNPIVTDNLTEIISQVSGKDFMTYHTDQITKDLSLASTKFHVFDIETDEQLDVLASVTRTLPEKILYVGSAGLASALFKGEGTKLATLSVVGSTSGVSFNQMDYSEANGVNILTISLNELVTGDVITKYVDRALILLDQQKDVVLTVTRTKEDYYNNTMALHHQLGIEDKYEISRIIKETLAKIAYGVISRTTVSGVFLTGGDTAIEVIHKLGAAGCIIRKELFTGVVESQLVGGEFSGMHIVTKAGAFGQKDTLFKCIQYLKQRG